MCVLIQCVGCVGQLHSVVSGIFLLSCPKREKCDDVVRRLLQLRSCVDNGNTYTIIPIPMQFGVCPIFWRSKFAVGENDGD